MAKLYYALVGEGDCLDSLSVRGSDRVSGLIEQIRTTQGWARGTRPNIRLYLAKQNGDKDGLWLEEGEDELEQLFQTNLPIQVQELYLRRELRLKLSAQVSQYFPGESVAGHLQEGPIHLLVDARIQAESAPNRHPASSMVELYYALVGEGDCRGSVTVRDSDRVSGLAEQISGLRGWARGTRPDVRLFLAKQKGDIHRPWLEEGEDELEQLFQTNLPIQVQELYLRRELRLKLSAQVSQYFPIESLMDGLTENPIHLLVDARPPPQRASAFPTVGMPRRSDQAKLVDTNATPLKRQSFPSQWTEEAGRYPQLNFDDSKLQMLRIPADYLVKSGVVSPQPNADLLLYRRAALDKEWMRIQEVSVDASSRLWIVGAPGTGKSCAAYAFACGKVDRKQWDVVWVHFSGAKDQFQLVKFVGDRKSTRVIPAPEMSSLPETTDVLNGLLKVSALTRKTLVFYDGYQKPVEQSEHVRRVLDTWQQLDPSCRRLVCVASLEWIGEIMKQARPLQREPPRSGPMSALTAAITSELRTLTEFRLDSWTLEEYIAAIAHDEFFQQVQHYLHRTPPTTTRFRTRARTQLARDLVKEKYYVVGGSARFMFTQSTDHCMEDLEQLPGSQT